MTKKAGDDFVAISFARSDWDRIRRVLHKAAVDKPVSNARENELRGQIEEALAAAPELVGSAAEEPKG